MALWGNKTNASDLTDITSTEQFFSVLVDLGIGELAHCQLEVDFPTNAQEAALITVYSTLDTGSNPKWDKEGSVSFYISPPKDPNIVSFIVEKRYRFRVGIVGGPSETIPCAKLSYRKSLL